MFGFVVLPQPGSVLMLLVHTNAWGLECSLCHEGVRGPCRCRCRVDLSGLCCHQGPGLPRVMSVSMALQQSGSELTSMAPVTTEDHEDNQILLSQLFETMLVPEGHTHLGGLF